MSLRQVKVLILSIFFFSSPLWAVSSNPQVILETSKGVIEIELLRDAAPISTANFLDYVEKGFYNRYNLPSSDLRFYDPGRRLHLEYEAEGD